MTVLAILWVLSLSVGFLVMAFWATLPVKSTPLVHLDVVLPLVALPTWGILKLIPATSVQADPLLGLWIVAAAYPCALRASKPFSRWNDAICRRRLALLRSRATARPSR